MVSEKDNGVRFCDNLLTAIAVLAEETRAVRTVLQSDPLPGEQMKLLIALADGYDVMRAALKSAGTKIRAEVQGLIPRDTDLN